MSNPTPPKATQFTTENAAENGAKGGTNKKGSLHLSTIIRELADNIDWDKTTLNNKDELKEKYGKNGFKALIYVAFTKAMTGDTKAMDWLSKNGYGTKLDITMDGEVKLANVEFLEPDGTDNSPDTD